MSSDGHIDSGLMRGRDAMLALLRRRIRSERVIAAMAAVTREAFVPAPARAHAYDDRALPIPGDQTISQPLMVALMLEAAEIEATDHALEVGTGSGYEAAVMSRLAGTVVSVERVPDLCRAAEERLRVLGYTSVAVHPATDALGWPPAAPYDAIVVAAAAPHVPRVLLEQLGPSGRLVIPVGDRENQQLVRARRTSHGVAIERLGACAFVPLIGRDAWPDADGGRASRRLKV